jgi:hypothetical protein
MRVSSVIDLLPYEACTFIISFICNVAGENAAPGFKIDAKYARFNTLVGADLNDVGLDDIETMRSTKEAFIGGWLY